MADERIIHQAASSVAAKPPALPVEDEVLYPCSDGHFLPGDPLQVFAIMNVFMALTCHFYRTERVYIGIDMYLYYERGDPDKRVAPDLFVVLDLEERGRSVYKLWEEGKPPCFALEVISPDSEIRNTVEKRNLYERLGIREHFMFQPDPEREEPRLVGHRLIGGAYQPVFPEPGGGLRSETLGVLFHEDGEKLRVRDLATGKDYPWGTEIREWQEAEAEARRRAEARVALARAWALVGETRIEVAIAGELVAEPRIEEAESRLKQLEAEFAELGELLRND